MKRLLTVLAFITVSIVRGEGTFTLLEINPLHGNSGFSTTYDSAESIYGAGALSGFVEMGGKLYFDAQSTPGHDELWVTDGTVQGTLLVKNINPDSGAAIGNMVQVGNYIIFMATDNDTTWNLWSTDGTDTGTQKINVLNQRWNTALSPNRYSLLGNRVLFCSSDKILVSDGTAGGTNSVISIAGYTQGFGYCDLKDNSYFILPETGGDNEIWRSDGTTSGTKIVADLTSNPLDIVGVGEVLSFNDKIYMSATPNQQSSQLFTFDGTGQIDSAFSGSGTYVNPHGLTVFSNALYFIASNGNATNLYRISATDSIPVPLIPGANFSSLSNLTIVNNTAYCIDSSRQKIHAVELTGFTYSSLNLQGYQLPAFADSNTTFLLGLNNQVFFEAYDLSTGKQVFMQSDFTDTGTVVVMPVGANTVHPFNYNLGGGNADVFDLRIWNDELLLPANFNDAGRELWVFNTSVAAGISSVKSNELFTIYPNPAGNELTVAISPCNNCGQSISIYNAYGQLVLTKAVTIETTSVSLSNLSAGYYYITLNESGKMVSTRQLAVVK